MVGAARRRDDAVMARASTIDRRLGEWEGAGLLTPEQAAAIHDFEAARPVAASRRFGRLIGIVAVFAVLLIGAGVAEVVASNWDAVPDAVKLGALVAAVVGLEAGGWRLQQAGTYRRTGGVLILAGYLLYGSGIHLVAQTYHRPLDDPSLLLLWFLPALPLAHLARSGLVAVAGVAVGYGALGIRLDGWLEGAAGSVVWAAPYMALAALLLAVGGLAAGRGRDGVAAGYGFAGAATATLLLFVAGFRWWYDDWAAGGGLPAEVLAIVVLATVATLGLLARRLAGRPAAREDLLDGSVAAGVLAFAWLWALDAALPWQAAYAGANVALLGMVVWLVARGLLRRREALVNLGVVVFAVALLTRYVEIGVGMLGTGFSFLGSGLVLLAVAVGLERARRRLLAGIVKEAADAR